ncbi:MAG TPA: hypothetical protein PKA77_16630 [Chitinophagaceae bacterium]|nr:hypothetical protein [Chitinophagaceae bacterium]
MTKLQKIQRQLSEVESAISAISFERKDTSYRRSGGYFGTAKADTDDCIIIKSVARTRYLNTYICIYNNKTNQLLKLKFDELKNIMAIEQARLAKIARNKWAKESIVKAWEVVRNDVANGWHKTNYGKIMMQGDRHIYYAHPSYGHDDYNKWMAMPNTPANWKAAQEINEFINSNK